MLVFLDTNIVIYSVENPVGFGPRAEAEIRRLKSTGAQLAISELVRLEARVKPMSQGNMVLLGDFDRFFASGVVQVFQLTQEVCERATELRAIYNFKLADALQLAAAIVHGCARFLTADARLNRCSDIPVDVLP